jgi:hypothetical protein
MSTNRIAELEANPPPAGAWWPAEPPTTSEDLKRQANAYLQQATLWIKQHPEIALTSAVVIGVVLGWFIKRR